MKNSISSKMFKLKKILLSSLFLFFISITIAQKLRVAIAGLTHDHVHNVMHQFKNGEVIIVGIAETNEQLVQRYKKTYQLPDSLFYKDLATLLQHVKPDAVLAY